MKNITSREIRLISRPTGMPTPANFSLTQTELAPLQDGQVLVRNLYMSVDPYMRGRMNGGKSYVSPFELDKPMSGGAVGEVVESRAHQFKPGDAVTSSYGWREYFIAMPKELHPISRNLQPLSVYLGALGMTGMTAWAGLNLVDVKAGDIIFISGAAGAVGSMAGQLAKLRGCEVIGSAGSLEKVKFLREECGFDLEGAFAFTLVLGITIFVQGVIQVSLAFQMRRISPNWGWMLVSGIIGIIFGVFVWSISPLSAAWLIGILIGTNLLFDGMWMLTLHAGQRHALEPPRSV